MSSPLISFMQRLQGPRLIALISLAIVLVVQLIVSGMSLLLQGKITTDYLLTGFVAASLAGPPSLWFIHSALDMLAQTSDVSLKPVSGAPKVGFAPRLKRHKCCSGNSILPPAA